MGVRRPEAATASETMNRPVDERYETLSARVRDALRNRQHVRDVMTGEELQELEERRRAYSEALERYNQELRESIQNMREGAKQKALEQAELDGVDLPEAAAEDHSPTGQAIRCQFYLVSLAKEPWRVSAASRWQNYQKRWFAHPNFDRSEYNRLIALYNLPHYI